MVENTKRGRGRPRCFDENEALDKAIGVFWRKGFHATSLDDLSEAMGMGRPSLYLAFGDKESVFMRSLQRYRETISSRPLCAMEEAERIDDAIRAYLRGTVSFATGNSCQLGCMMGVVAAAVNDPKVREFVAAGVAAGRERIEKRLQTAVDAGELPPDFPVERRARRAVNAMLALAARARHGAPVEELLEDAEDAATAVLS